MHDIYTFRYSKVYLKPEIIFITALLHRCWYGQFQVQSHFDDVRFHSALHTSMDEAENVSKGFIILYMILYFNYYYMQLLWVWFQSFSGYNLPKEGYLNASGMIFILLSFKYFNVMPVLLVSGLCYYLLYQHHNGQLELHRPYQII